MMECVLSVEIKAALVSDFPEQQKVNQGRNCTGEWIVDVTELTMLFFGGSTVEVLGALG